MKKLSDKKAKKEHVTPHLMKGMESKEMIECLIKGTRIDSERKVKALLYHFVDGAPIGNAATAFSLPQSNLTECIETLNKIAGVCQKFHELKMHSKIYQK